MATVANKPRAVFPMLIVTCRTCGYAAMVNALKLGLLTKAPEQETSTEQVGGA
jgi:hypothetical protein